MPTKSGSIYLEFISSTLETPRLGFDWYATYQNPSVLLPELAIHRHPDEALSDSSSLRALLGRGLARETMSQQTSENIMRLVRRSERLMFVTENMRCCAGPPLPDTLKLLAPLANLEELSLSGNELGGAITADVVVLTKLKKLDLYLMGLDGKLLSIPSKRLNGSCDFQFGVRVQASCPSRLFA